jgi:putative hemolysin
MMEIALIGGALLILASAFCSSGEIAFFSLPASRIKSYRLSLDTKKRQVAKILQQSKSLLVMIFLLNTIVNILLQNVFSDIFYSGNWLEKVFLPLVLILLFGELIPKYFGLIYNEWVAITYAAPISWLLIFTAPLRVCLTTISDICSRVLFFFLKPEYPLSKEELQHILQSSEGKGLLHRDEAELLLGVLTLDEKQCKEVMTPRSSMPFYTDQEPLSKLIYLFSTYRLPQVFVFSMPEDNILGYISIQDFFLHRPAIEANNNLSNFLKRPFYIPETTGAKIALEQLRQQNIPCALVVDEYGRVSGMLSQNDLVNQIVKTSTLLKQPFTGFTKVSKDAIVAEGTLPVDALEELFGAELTTQYHVVTIGGWITEQLGFLPKAGITHEYKDLFFRVISADPTRVRKLYIQKRGSQHG